MRCFKYLYIHIQINKTNDDRIVSLKGVLPFLPLAKHRCWVFGKKCKKVGVFLSISTCGVQLAIFCSPLPKLHLLNCHNFVKFTVIKPNCQKFSGCVFASGKSAMYPPKSIPLKKYEHQWDITDVLWSFLSPHSAYS